MSPRKILVIKLRALGDTVLMTAPLIELRRAFPEAELHVAVTKTWAPLLANHPAIDQLWEYERHSDGASRAKALARFAYRLRKEHFDCVVNLHASPSSALLAFSTGAKTRAVHFHGHRDRNRYSTVVVPGKGTLKPIIERDMDTIRALGLHVPAGRLPSIDIQATERSQAQDRLNQLGLSQPVLGLGLGASRPTKQWPIERFAALAVSWVGQKQGSVFAFAGPGEDERIHAFLHAIDDLLSSTIEDSGKRAAIRARITADNTLPLRQLAAVLSTLSVFAGNDSGPRHIAVATGISTVTFFGPEHPFEWHPYPLDKHPYLFVEQLPCRKDADPGMPEWCALDVCVMEQHRCMGMLGVDEALKECIRVAR